MQLGKYKIDFSIKKTINDPELGDYVVLRDFSIHMGDFSDISTWGGHRYTLAKCVSIKECDGNIINSLMHSIKNGTTCWKHEKEISESDYETRKGIYFKEWTAFRKTGREIYEK